MTRFLAYAGAIILSLLSFLGLMLSPWFVIPLVVFGFLAILGTYDVVQPHHSILRNYPVLGHMRFMFEGIRPEIRQYLIENDQDEEPFSREARSLVYQRAKGQEDKRPFGTRRRVYDAGFEWLTHSAVPNHIDKQRLSYHCRWV